MATECKGDGDLLQSLMIENIKTGETKELPVNGLFYAIGTFRFLPCFLTSLLRVTFRSRAGDSAGLIST